MSPLIPPDVDVPLSGPATSPTSPPVESVSGRVLASTGILVLGRVFAGGLSVLVRTVVLARLLGPENMGVFGGAMVIIALCEVLSETGLRKGLIQTNKVVEPYLATVWTSNAARGGALAVLIYVSAPWLAALFNRLDTVDALRLLCLLPAMQGIQSIGMTLFERRMRFAPIVGIQVVASAIEMAVAVSFAVWSPSVWALIWGSLAGVLSMLIGSYIVTGYRPKLGFRWDLFRELFRFGFWIFIAGVVSLLLIKGGDLVIMWHFEDAAVLGVFQVAYLVATVATVEIGRVIMTVALPAFSTMQSDLPRLRSAFERSYIVIAFVSCGLTLVIAASAPAIQELFLGARYEEAATLIPILALWGLCRTLGASNSTVFIALGRPALASAFIFVMLLLFAVVVWPLTDRFGLVGVASALAGTGLAGQVLRYPLMAQVLEMPIRIVYSYTAAPAIAAITVYAIHRTASTMLDFSAGVQLATIGTLGPVLYVLTAWITSRLFSVDLSAVASTLRREILHSAK